MSFRESLLGAPQASAICNFQFARRRSVSRDLVPSPDGRKPPIMRTYLGSCAADFVTDGSFPISAIHAGGRAQFLMVWYGLCTFKKGYLTAR